MNTSLPLRSAWVEVNLKHLANNFDLIARDKPRSLSILSVVKDHAYGHGMIEVSRVALAQGARFLAVSTVHEGTVLRDAGVTAPILILGERQDDELKHCVERRLTICVNHVATATQLARMAAATGSPVPVHLKVNTGMNRYGIHWEDAARLGQNIARIHGITLEGVLSHFSMSDEADKTFAHEQMRRFRHVVENLEGAGIRVPIRHLCNSGGFLDLPDAHWDMVRLGLLPLGVFPSQVCRRIHGIQPVMSVKARIAALQQLSKGDTVGYGLKYHADSPRLAAVLPIGYGDGFPRLRNQGHVLIRGRLAPLIGGTAMDAIIVDVTGIAGVSLWDEAVIMGRQGEMEITAHDLARWKGSVSYDILTGWRNRLPRVHLPATDAAPA